MAHTAELSTLLTQHLDQLEHRQAAVDHLRREADTLTPDGSAEVLPVLDLVDGAVRRGDESARTLLGWLRAGSV